MSPNPLNTCMRLRDMLTQSQGLFLPFFFFVLEGGLSKLVVATKIQCKHALYFPETLGFTPPAPGRYSEFSWS